MLEDFYLAETAGYLLYQSVSIKRNDVSIWLLILLFAPWDESWVISSILAQLWVQLADPKSTHPCHHQTPVLGIADPPSSYGTVP